MLLTHIHTHTYTFTSSQPRDAYVYMLLAPPSKYVREVPCVAAFVRDHIAEFRRASYNLGLERVG